MKIAVPREIRAGETRVALDPESCKKLIQLGMEVAVEAGAGSAANFTDRAYQDAGATLVADPASLLASAEFALKVNAPQARPDGTHEADLIKPGTMLLASIFPTRNLDAVERMAEVANRASAQAGVAAAAAASSVQQAGSDRRRHHPARQGLRHRRWRGGPAGHRHRQAAGRQRHGHGRAARGEGTDRIRGRQVRGHRPQAGCLRGRGLCRGAIGRGQGPAGQDAGGALRHRGRGHHHGPHRRRLRPEAAG